MYDLFLCVEMEGLFNEILYSTGEAYFSISLL